MSKDSDQIENANRIEMLKLMYDRYKHITTLASGSLVITASFYDKIFTPNNVKQAAIIIVCFLLSIITSTTAMNITINQIPRDLKTTLWHRFFILTHYFIPEIFFSVGVFFLAFSIITK